MKKKLNSILVIVMAIVMTIGIMPINAQVISKESDSIVEKETQTDFAEGQAIILYKNSNVRASIFREGNTIQEGITVSDTYDFGTEQYADVMSTNTSDSGFSISLVTSDEYSTQELISILEKRSDVKYVEPNFKIKTMDTDDTYKKYQWAINNMGQNGGTPGLDINSDSVTDVNTDEKVIALVDTGIDYTHPDLKNVVWNNPVVSKQLKGKHGYDFVNQDSDPFDDNGHGSHCSGIIAGEANNGQGISGVAGDNNVKIMALKILDEEGFSYGSEAIGAYNYIYKAQQMGINVVAINNSWGATSEDPEASDIFKEVIDITGKAGALSVCAAGNEAISNDEYTSIPCCIDSPYVISVGASNEKDQLAIFSNYGSNVDIAAPGTDILSTVSYYNFNPTIYEDKAALCSSYESFESGNLVNVIEENKIIKQPDENQIAYGVSAGNESNVSISKETFFGSPDDGKKSLKWQVKGARKGQMYTLYLPYTAQKSSTAIYSSFAIKTGSVSENGIGDISSLEIYDCQVNSDGTFDDNNGNYINDFSVYNTNYWNVLTQKVANTSNSEKQHVIAFKMEAVTDGDYTLYIDNLGVSKGNVQEEQFGKYDFYNGTSMATPHVTGAVAIVASVFDDESAEDRKARIVGSIRNSSSLVGKIKSGGVLDLSKTADPTMSVESTQLNSKKQIEIKGHYLKDATVRVNNQPVSVIENTNNKIVINGADYINKKVSIQLIKDDNVLNINLFVLNGTRFKKEELNELYMEGGSAISDGDNLYYVTDTGLVYEGSYTMAEEDTDGKEMMYFNSGENEWAPDIFGEDYKTTVDYTISADSNIICLNKVLYAVIKIDVGFSEHKILAYYNSDKGWMKYADIPKEMEGLDGTILASYNGSLYLMGGYDETDQKCSTLVMSYNALNKKWNQVAQLPEGRCFSEAMQVENQLVVTLGGNGQNEDIENLIFNGSSWSRSKDRLGNVFDVEVYGENNFPVISGQTGIVKGGIIYTNIKSEGLGDTFTYSLSSDRFVASKYSLFGDELTGNNVVATTVDDKLIVLYGLQLSYEDFELFKQDMIDDMIDDIIDEYLEQYSAKMMSIPVESGYINVVDKTQDYGVYIDGAGHYRPGDIINLTAKAEEGYFVKSFTVNGKSVAAKNGKYTYTAKANDNVSGIHVSATSGAYITEIYLQEEVDLEKPAKGKRGKAVQLHADVYPDDAANAKIIWKSSNPKIVTVDSNGKLRATKYAKIGQEVVVTATAADRGTVSAECIVYITKPGKSLPVKNKKYKVGQYTYKVTKSAKKNGTVTCISFNNKKARKAVIGSIVKINGYTFKITKIADNAFKNKRNLQKVTIGKNITSVGKNAFKGCKKLKKIIIKSAAIKSFGKGAFKSTHKKLIIEVPNKVKKKYKFRLKKAGFKGKVK